MAKYDFYCSGTYLNGYVEVTESSVSTSANTSKVTVNVYIHRSNSWSGLTTSSSVDRYVKIDGTEYKTSGSFSIYASDGYKKWASASKTITHNADGSKSISVSFRATDNYTSYFNVGPSTSSITLTKIARTIPISSISATSRSDEVSATIKWTDNGNAVVIKCEEIDDNNTYKSLIREWTGQKGKSGTKYSLTAAQREAYDKKNRNKIRWTLTTMSGDTKVGTSSKDFSYQRKTYPTAFSLDVGEEKTISWTRQKEAYTHNLVVTSGEFTKTIAEGAGTSAIWLTEEDKEALYDLSTTSKSITGTATLTTYNGSTNLGSASATFTANFTGDELKPVFEDFHYEDTNPVSLAITENNQYAIQNISQIVASVPLANKAIAQYGAEMQTYTATFSGSTTTSAYSDTEDVVLLGLNCPSAGSQTLTMSAQDSRTISTSISKSVEVLPYSAPILNATASRVNNFENDVEIKVNGTLSAVTVEGVNKNTIPAGGIKYRYKKTSETEWSNWVGVNASVTDGTFTTAQPLVVNLDNNYAFDIQLQANDRLQSTTIDLNVAVGIPIFRISTSDNKLYNNERRVLTEDDIDAKKAPLWTTFYIEQGPDGNFEAVTNSGRTITLRRANGGTILTVVNGAQHIKAIKNSWGARFSPTIASSAFGVTNLEVNSTLYTYTSGYLNNSAVNKREAISVTTNTYANLCEGASGAKSSVVCTYTATRAADNQWSLQGALQVAGSNTGFNFVTLATATSTSVIPAVYQRGATGDNTAQCWNCLEILETDLPS